ncbi:MAG TPA: BlaI/MecI/CopY family transcriptional regulator [Bryobacteraceae bacterium]|nr:BlaI/MecI/CopY family transcriptional regulator [Bryobacteraceae bacterium]
MRPRSTTLTTHELELMKIVWRLERATVRDVYEELLKERKVAYTSVMTMMKVLEQKGHLRKSSEDKAHIYTPAQPQRNVIGDMVREFVNRVFDGSAEPLLAHLVEDKRITPAELAEIARMRGKK